MVLALTGTAHAITFAPLPSCAEVPCNQLFLILIPPITTGYEVLTSAPFVDWQEADSYHDWTDCHKALETFFADYTMKYQLRHADGLGFDELTAVDEQARHAICIGDADPRLAR